eukprot:1161622-Pelagomonas_calceolata.AAC.23
MHPCHISPHASQAPALQAHAFPALAARPFPCTRARGLGTHSRVSYPQAAAARKQQPQLQQQQPQAADWQMDQQMDEQQLARLAFFREKVAAEETSLGFDFLGLDEAPSSQVALESWLQGGAGDGGSREERAAPVGLEPGVSTLTQAQQILYPPDSSRKVLPESFQAPVLYPSLQQQQQQQQQQSPQRQRRRPRPPASSSQAQQLPEQQPPQYQQGQQQQQQQQELPQHHHHRQKQQPWWSLPVRQAEAACPPPVALALKQASRATGSEENGLSPLSGSSDTTLFVKGLNAQAPEKLMRAALVEAFSQAGQLAQFCAVLDLQPCSLYSSSCPGNVGVQCLYLSFPNMIWDGTKIRHNPVGSPYRAVN